MKPKELVAMGLPIDCINSAIDAIKVAFQQKYGSKNQVRDILKKVISSPKTHLGEVLFGTLAEAIIASRKKYAQETEEWGKNPVGQASGYAKWGGEQDQGSIDQMNLAIELPVSVAGAIMADSHLGYGIPIGGVLATYNSVIPYGVGVDISCSMKCTITDLPVKSLEDVFSPKVDPLILAITGGTVFGIGGTQKIKANASVMDMDWNITSITRELKDKAWNQLGTSGSGNHFVEFGIVTLDQSDLGLEPGQYVALLSHSGSRGTGANVCKVYSDIAKSKLPKAYERFINLAWLSLDSEAGQEYWKAMNLMYHYAIANHETIHNRVCDLAGAKPIAVITNSHNLAWEEEHIVNGQMQKLIVHRKGATPAGVGVLGVIPGSMADPAFIVRGKGSEPSLQSASHGAGRKMSRTQAIKTLNWANWKSIIKGRGVRLLSACLDEVPGAYKDIRTVMAAQTDLVDVVARFDPRLVKMSDDGKAED